MRKTTTTTMALLAALALAGCGSTTEAAPAPEAPPVGSAPRWTPAPEPVAPEVTAEDLLKRIAIDALHEEGYDAGRSDGQIVSDLEGICAEFKAHMDGGQDAATYIMGKVLTLGDGSEQFGADFAGAVMGFCPEVVEHPNYGE